MKKISIVIPVYNVEAYLEECLDSILSQKYTDYEIICVNDASTDSSLQILQHYNQQYPDIKIISNDRNRGLSYTRNHGLLEAEGDYVWFVDSDDLICENALKEISDIIENQTADILFFNMMMRDESDYAKKNPREKKKNLKENQIQSGLELLKEFYEKNNWKIEVWRQIYRRQFLTNEGLRFFEGILHEDNLFTFQSLIKAERVINVEKEFYVYRRREGSIMATMIPKRMESLLVVFEESAKVWQKLDAEEQVHMAIRQYLTNIVIAIRRCQALFPEYHILTMGNAYTQFLFDILAEKISGVFLEENQLNFLREKNTVIVYGAGLRGIDTIKYLNAQNIKVSFAAVTSKSDNKDEICQVPVRQIDELLEYSADAAVVIAIAKKNMDEMKARLMDLGFQNSVCINY